MKTKDYLEKYDLKNGFKSKVQVSFVEDMNTEFVNSFNNMGGVDISSRIKNAIKEVRSKWDAISNKTPYGIPDKLWGFFYATKIAPFKDSLIQS